MILINPLITGLDKTPAPACPACQSNQIVYLGPSYFVGWAECPEVADLRALSGGLHRCKNCDLVFRWPRPSHADLERAYRNIPITWWEHVEPSYWKILFQQIKAHAANKNVLDIGCFRGDFLASLGSGFQLFGIEPNPGAAEAARNKGVNIIGTDAFDDLSAYTGTFGAIVLMDVMEHLANPLEMLSRAKALLAPGGVVVILTGDSSYWIVRYSLPYYWYMSFPIHLVYLGRVFMRWAATRQGFRVIKFVRTPHKPNTFSITSDTKMRAFLIAFLKNSWLARVLPLRGRFKRLAAETEPRLFFPLPDHMIVVLQKAN